MVLLPFVFAALCVAAGVAATPPEEMRAAVVSSRSWDFKFHLEKVEVVDKPVPMPGHGQVLVQVQASNLNPVDHKIVELLGLFWSYPHGLGTDVTGVVVAVGPGCERLKVGDEVWGESPDALGTFAQYAVVTEGELGIRPRTLTVIEAGAMPMVALTGYESLTWAAGGPAFKDDVTVLVLGGSGGTGHLGVQLAKAMGAKQVITTASAKHTDFLRGLGADQVIDYHTQNYYEVLAPKSVDVVYDCVGQAGTGDHAFGLVKDHGHFITLLRSGLASWLTRLRRLDVHEYSPLCVGSCVHYDRIDAIAAMVEKGKLQVHVDKVYDLEDIRAAFAWSIAGHTIGKVVVTMAGNASAVTAAAPPRAAAGAAAAPAVVV